MSKKYLIVVDMQNDFIDGTLGSKEAQAIVPAVVEKIKNFDGNIIFTKDTHFETETKGVLKYGDTLEGKLLPVPHCLIDASCVPTIGHRLNEDVENAIQLNQYANEKDVIWKYTFGSLTLPNTIKDKTPVDEIESIEICGLCTDICVVSNALILRAAFPNIPMKVDSKCCAGVTPAKHEAALEVMRSCQIEVI